MTKFNCIYGLLAVLFSSIAFGQLDSLEGQRLAPDNESVLFETSISYAIARQGQRAVDSSALVRGFAETSTHVYSLSSKLQVVQTRVEGRVAERHWPLTRWPQEYQEPELTELYRAHDLGEKGRELQHLSAYFLGNNLGCYPLTPLRYGDINGNGINEIVLFIGYDLLVFSPDQGKVIFGQRLRQNEWLSKEETDNYFDHYGRRGDHLPQYQSSLASGVAGVGQGQVAPGLRGYSKLYFGDFNEDGVHDILVWRKLYISRLVGDETEGFEQLRDTLLHYSLIGGEYQPQETDEATIRGWLAANELTWQKGYPNKSECEGEEGELIPEMHDPLLNDLDVLQ